eukprot:SM000244S08549  [mRNA]  locus=s244:2006:7033:- [translate_table: standard]
MVRSTLAMLDETMDGIHLSGMHAEHTPPTPRRQAGKDPFIIGVAGGTASGKTTVCDQIIQQLHDHRVVLVNQDSFYRGLTEDELEHVSEYNFDHPDAFDTDSMLECLNTLKAGRAVEIPVYDFKSHQRRTDRTRKVSSKDLGAQLLAHRPCDSFGEPQMNAADVVILEGILVFLDPQVRSMMNMKIFVEAVHGLNGVLLTAGAIAIGLSDADVRLARRIRRDTLERGRDVHGVIEQVSPPHSRPQDTEDMSQDIVHLAGFIMNSGPEYAKFVKPAFDDFVLPTKKHADVIIPRGGDNRVAIDLIVQHLRIKLGQHDLRKIYPNVYVIHSTFQIRGMHTLIRDRETKKHDFVFYADRLNRLNNLLVGHVGEPLPVAMSTGSTYVGVDFCRKLCGVSIIRSGESMENALRACCKGIRIGKILIHREGDNGKQLIYEKLPKDIAERHVLLLDPILATGNSAVQAIELLINKGVPESHIIFLNLISAPEGIHIVCKRFPTLKIVTSEIDHSINDKWRVVPGMGEFGDRYFGTIDDDDGGDDSEDDDHSAASAALKGEDGQPMERNLTRLPSCER